MKAAIAEYNSTLIPLAEAFNESGHSLYLVGGSVRDALLGVLGHDLDFCTDARPEVIYEILDKCCETVWDTGIRFGTVSASFNGQIIEITTFRADEYDGETRKPVVSFGDNLDGDLVRRDFTVNAMALELRADGNHEFHDPLAGLVAMDDGQLDTPCEPDISFHDDPLRILRAARFVAQLDFRVSDRVFEAMTSMAEELKRISAERVRQELDKLMLSPYPWKGIDLLCATGVADVIFPEIPALKLAPDEHFRHKDVYQHSLKVLQQAMEQEPAGEPDLVLRWAALLHDIGKPSTRDVRADGGVTFYNHAAVGAKLAKKRMRALTYSNQMIKDVANLIFLHMRFYGYSEGEWTDSAVRRYVADAGPQLDQLNKLTRADCTTRNQRKANRLRRAMDQLEERIVELKKQEDLAKVRPALDGNAIMEILNLKPGPMVGKAWNYLKDLRLEYGPMDHDESVARLKAWAAENGIEA
ncbi:MAG: CCA tRNA nucleotidyltransferase [Corynebacterium sp.]|nr:CCA tRNA nucleotidyltransferase [Corynebacterium sp.]